MDKKFVLRTSRGHEYPIVNMTSIGRNADCMIRINHPVVSGHHASVWVVQDRLWVSDNNSTNGVFVNGERIPPGQGYLLYNGDRIHLGDSPIEIEVFGGPSRPGAMSPSRPVTAPPAQTSRPPTLPPQTAPKPQPARRLAPIACLTMLGCLSVLILGAFFSYFFLGTDLTNLLPGQTRVLAVSTPQPLLKAQEYAASSQTLAQAVAQLNQSELAFIRAAQSQTSSLPKLSLVRFTIPLTANNAQDEQLRQVAADAFRVATIANSLSQTMAAQDGGSQQAGQMAGQYASVARLGAALVIETQDLREGLKRGSVTQASASNVVAEYGARLWNPSVKDPTKPGNPFTTYLSDPSTVPVAQLFSKSSAAQLATQLGSDLSSWVAASSEQVKKKFDIPDLSTIGDALLVADLLTPAGQADSTSAKQAAANIIKAGGTNAPDTQSSDEQLAATFASAIAVGASDTPGTPPSSDVMTFPKGQITIINQSPSSDTIAGLISVDGNNPSILAQVPVKDTQPLVTLELSNLSIKMVNPLRKSTFEAEVSYELDVTWTANLATPQFELDCVSGNHFDISTASGSKHLSAKGLLLLYPGNEDAYCYASHNGNTWGSASVQFLVGDAADATRRADQVETDSVSLNLTLTSDALGTLEAQNANAAASATALAIENAVSTEVYGTRTAEFIATITEIARQTRDAPTPSDTETPIPTATFAPVLVETFYHPGDVHAVAGSIHLTKGHLYRVCLTGVAYTTEGPQYPNDIEHVNGIKVPVSGCVVIEGNGAVVVVTCSGGIPAEDPGGFTIKVLDLGPD